MPNYGRQSLSSKKLPVEKPLLRFRNIILVIVCFLLVTPFLFQIKPVSSQTIYVPDSYATIQEAADNAVAGDTIHVASGTYYEHVTVEKTLSIEGENPATTIVDGTANGTVFDLEASNVHITGFTIRNSGSNYGAIVSERNATTNDYHYIANNIISGSQYAVFLSLSNHNTISSNVIETSQYGVSVSNSTYNTISSNVIETSQYGVSVSSSTYSTISNNIIEANQYGVSVSDSTYSTITSNTFASNIFGGLFLRANSNSNNIISNNITDSAYGIKFESSISNIIEGNTISETSYAVHLTLSSTGNTIRYNTIRRGKTAGVYSSSDNTIVHHNTIADCDYGIYYYSCKSGTIYYNVLSDNSIGIRLYTTTATNTVTNNKIRDNTWGIELVSANSNTFTGNWIQDNAWGISLSTASSNNIYHNNFFNNALQATGTGTNNWYVSNQGNYWSDYKGQDANGDGIGDTQYKLQSVVQDNYPLIYTWSEHDIEVRSVTASANEIDPGTIVSITVIVKNKANITATETFAVTAKYNTTVIGTQQVSNLAKGATQNLVFNWNTTGVAAGNYTIRAEASVVTDELNIDNNSLFDGTVKVRMRILIGDINRDGTINNSDLVLLVLAYGSTPSDSNWNLNADLNKDNQITIADLNILAKNFGTHV
jgi:parallel beta-helix repeat protein